jgi:carbonic anhydrase
MSHLSANEIVGLPPGELFVQDAWQRSQSLRVHALIYDVADGLLQELGFNPSREEEVPLMYESAMRTSPKTAGAR